MHCHEYIAVGDLLLWNNSHHCFTLSGSSPLVPLQIIQGSLISSNQLTLLCIDLARKHQSIYIPPQSTRAQLHLAAEVVSHSATDREDIADALTSAVSVRFLMPTS